MGPAASGRPFLSMSPGLRFAPASSFTYAKRPPGHGGARLVGRAPVAQAASLAEEILLVFFLVRGELMGPAAAGRPFCSMSPGLRCAPASSFTYAKRPPGHGGARLAE